MTVSPTLQKYLDQSVTYDLIPHAPTMSSTRTAEACHVPGEALAKAVVLRRDGGYMMAVLPASRHLHLSALKSQLGHKVDLASEDEIERLFEDCDRGAVPPLGECYGLDVIIDDSIDARRHVYMESGDHATLIRMEGDAIRAIDGEGLARPLQHARLRPRVPPAAPRSSDFKQDAPHPFAVEQARAVWDDSIATGRRFSDGPQRSSRSRTSNRLTRTG